MTDRAIEHMQKEWTDEEIALVREIAPQAWMDWQTAWGNPDVMITGWDELSEETRTDWTNVIAKSVRYWDAKRLSDTEGQALS